MQSLAPKLFKTALKTPTILAMLGSVVFHGLLVVSSGIVPPEPQPQRLRIVAIAPKPLQGGHRTGSLKSNLFVPGTLPPVNLSQIPKSWKFPDVSKLTSRTPFFFPRSTLSPINLDKIQMLNLPRKSLSEKAQRSVGKLSAPNSAQQNDNSLLPGALTVNQTQSPQPSLVEPASPVESLSLPISPDTNKTNIPEVEQPSQSITPEPSEPSTAALPPSPSVKVDSNPPPSSNAITSDTWTEFKRWLEAHSIRNAVAIKAETGPPLTAAYPPEACTTKQQGTAIIAAIYGPDGNITGGIDSIRVLRPSPTTELTQAARAAVSSYHPPASETYQGSSLRPFHPFHRLSSRVISKFDLATQ
jgi:Gram-negative bacterial TonB protein C-terminal